MKRLILAGVILAGSLGVAQLSVPQASAQPPGDCSLVRCADCPVGFHPALRPPICCRCLPD